MYELRDGDNVKQSASAKAGVAPDATAKSHDSDRNRELPSAGMLEGSEPPADDANSGRKTLEVRQEHVGTHEQLKQLRREDRQADRLDVENRFLQGDSVSGPVMHAALAASGEDFDALLSDLETEAMANALAAELTDIYRQFMERGLDGEHGDFWMDQMVCGLRLCIGETSADRALFEAALAQWHNDKGPPIYTLSELPVYDESGTLLGNRIIFSTDPESNSVAVPISYRPPNSESPSSPEQQGPSG